MITALLPAVWGVPTHRGRRDHGIGHVDRIRPAPATRCFVGAVEAERQLTLYIAHIATTGTQVTSTFDAKYGIHASSPHPTTDTVTPQRLVPAISDRPRVWLWPSATITTPTASHEPTSLTSPDMTQSVATLPESSVLGPRRLFLDT